MRNWEIIRRESMSSDFKSKLKYAELNKIKMFDFLGG